MPDTRINRPGAPANPPHTAREGTAMSDYVPVDDGEAPPVGPAVGPRDREGARDIAPRPDADPHPSDEGQPYAGDPNPRAVGLRYLDIAPNPAIHTGTPEPRPDNADHGPKYAPS
jgi:hypothetical protein